MTCRHQDPVNNPECSSYRTPAQQYEKAKKAADLLRIKYGITDTPDAENFEIEEIEQVGKNLVVKAKYPNCAKCAYEGHKVMVFADVSLKDAIKWRTLDPHFRVDANDHKHAHPKAAPSPIARFPASAEGWADAIVYATSKKTSNAR